MRGRVWKLVCVKYRKHPQKNPSSTNRGVGSSHQAKKDLQSNVCWYYAGEALPFRV